MRSSVLLRFDSEWFRSRHSSAGARIASGDQTDGVGFGGYVSVRQLVVPGTNHAGRCDDRRAPAIPAGRLRLQYPDDPPRPPGARSRFPIYTEHVDGHVRWKLVEGFSRVPALQFSATELMARVFTRDLTMPLEGTPIKDSIDSALVKVAGALPVSAEEYMQNLHGWFSAGIGPHRFTRSYFNAARIALSNSV